MFGLRELRGSGMSDGPGLFRSDVPCSGVFEDHLGALASDPLIASSN